MIGTSRVIWLILAAWATMTVVAALTAESLESSMVALSQLWETMMSPRTERIQFGAGIFMVR
jgi:hypothetical protein